MSAAENVYQLPLEGIGGQQPLAERPVPAEADLSGFHDMKLDLPRLMQSKTWMVVCKRQPELAYYMVNLWGHAWLQKPAGSLPDDDDELCEAARCDWRRWPQVRDAVLKDWRFCWEDGRRYHLFLCEKVKEAWESRVKFRAKAKEAADKRWEAIRRKREAEEAAAAGMPAASSGHAKGGGSEGEGKGGQDSPRPPAGPGPAAQPPGDAGRTLREVLETDGLDMLVAVTGRTRGGCEALLGQFCKDSGDHDESVLRIIQAAHRCHVAKRPKADPASWIRKAVRDDAAERRRQAAPPAPAPRGGKQAIQRGGENQATEQVGHFLAMDDRPFASGEAAVVIDHEEGGWGR